MMQRNGPGFSAKSAISRFKHSARPFPSVPQRSERGCLRLPPGPFRCTTVCPLLSCLREVQSARRKSHSVQGGRMPAALDLARSLEHELIALRRDFHRHPEIAWEKVRPSKIVGEFCEKQGLHVQRGAAKTGVIAILNPEKS